MHVNEVHRYTNTWEKNVTVYKDNGDTAHHRQSYSMRTNANLTCCLTSLSTANIILCIPKILRKISGVSFPTPKQGKKFIKINVRQHLDFEVQPNSVWHLKTNRHFTTHFLCLSNDSQPPWELGNFERVRKYMIRCVYACNDSGGGYFEYLLWNITWKIRIGNVYCKCIISVLCKILHR